MLTFDEQADFPFSCVSNETLAIVRAYNAVCIPGFFVGFNTLLPRPKLKGGLDAWHRTPVLPEAQGRFLGLGGLMQKNRVA